MRKDGLRRVMRGKVIRATVAGAKVPCHFDRVNREFRAQWLAGCRTRYAHVSSPAACR